MDENSNGRVTIREVYDQVDNLRREMGLKLDDLSLELKEHSKQDQSQDLKIQAIELWAKGRNNELQVKLDNALADHICSDHKSLTVTSTRVWAMWGIGIFAAMTVVSALIVQAVQKFF